MGIIALPGFAATRARRGSNVIQFSVGEHFKGKANKLVHWNCPIMPQGNPGNQPFISMNDAKDIVTLMLSWRRGAHPYIAYQACKLLSESEEIRERTVAIMAGSVAEDRVFLPGESVTDLIVAKPEDLPLDSWTNLRRVLEGKDRNLLDNTFVRLAKALKKLGLSESLDAMNRPYMGHFFDGNKGFHKGADTQKIEFVSALKRIDTYWKSALHDYKQYLLLTAQEGKEYDAALALTHVYLKIGHMVHLISDMCVPAHTKNDLHDPIIGKKDSLERWMTLADWQDIRRKEGKPNVRIWDSGSIAPPQVNSPFGLEAFVRSVVSSTQRFRSVDAKGNILEGWQRQEFEDEIMQSVPSNVRDNISAFNYLNQQKKGRLDGLECFMQGSVLIPQAIRVSAELILNFLATAKGEIAPIP